ncbi:hypothetical protein BX661DRAFT_195096 [Kickxella alabastrina]|uniref:uncharacterized protein n=1 Tax=Kickxella alabastrina TaxID=61397 RepID=UPI00221F6021|nr:uncharacterized protein BX661DRAFT_195096 [Kickxella alabastrina]KAI7834453.1 hypothetical protein BX661DRAFT_195096 [Kickxella alabastrina]KAJ1935850.1 hypothetical protein GGF37_005837 [Kickxella alabastrina]
MPSRMNVFARELRSILRISANPAAATPASAAAASTTLTATTTALIVPRKTNVLRRAFRTVFKTKLEVNSDIDNAAGIIYQLQCALDEERAARYVAEARLEGTEDALCELEIEYFNEYTARYVADTNCADAESKNAVLSAGIDAFKANLAELEAARAQEAGIRSAAEFACNSIGTAFSKLESALEVAKAAQAELAASCAQESLGRIMAEFELMTLRAQVAPLQHQLAKACNQANTAHNELGVLHAEAKVPRHELDKTSTKAKNAHNELEDLRAEVAKLRCESRASITTKHNEAFLMYGLADSAIYKNDYYSEKAADYGLEIDMMGARMDALRRKISERKAQLDSADGVHSVSIAELGAECGVLAMRSKMLFKLDNTKPAKKRRVLLNI